MKRAFLILMLIATLVLASCAKNSNSGPNDGQAAKPLYIAIASDPGTIDPAVSMDNSSWKVAYPAYERLVDFKGSSTSVKPALAKSWSVSKDGKIWTFILNKGHRFADGSKVDAQAVKYSFERVLKIAKGPVAVYGIISKVEAAGSSKVIFTLKQSFPPFLSTLAADYGNIVNPAVEKKAANGDRGQSYLATHTMGSGSYQLTQWKKGQYIRLNANKYAAKKPKTKQVVFKIVNDSSAQKLQLQKGEIDIAESIPNEQLKDLKSAKNVTIMQKPSFLVDYVYINNSKGNPALKDVKVRQALNHAINYNTLIDAVQQGYATRLTGPIPKGMWGYDATNQTYAYDTAKAKDLLQQAGVKNLKLNLLYSDNNPWWSTEALTIQSDLKKIGVQVTLKKVAYATSRDMMDKGKFDLALGVWSPDFADPFMFMNYWYDSANFGLAGNRAFYKNSQVDAWLRKAAVSNDHAERLAIYAQVQEKVIQDAPYILLYQKDFLLPMSTKVKGFVFNPMLQGMYNLADMTK
ncbi:ABC transporter substrate-binding protein [Sporolactobacillus sp. STCC-11]|uniref:ABC transporter substrate-binding protein n=1 Tax=Sporolactobacillus caesalpiniae TaxID=3230362 RepID=UPI003397BF97